MDADNPVPGEITSLLHRWSEGDREALAAVASLAFDDLRAIASGYLRRERGAHTLQATALVNELYIRLAAQRDVRITDRRHFFTLSAMIMRRILSDYARRASASKRPGDAARIPLHEDMSWVDAGGEDMLTLDQSLEELEELHNRSVRVVELRFFLGCTNSEIAEVLHISRTTVDRDLEFAKTWLFRRMNMPAGADPTDR
jgi:RNA polymerase sigma factor (TIGR02999 family)